jgi:hypothetical protein
MRSIGVLKNGGLKAAYAIRATKNARALRSSKSEAGAAGQLNIEQRALSQ